MVIIRYKKLSLTDLLWRMRSRETVDEDEPAPMPSDMVLTLRRCKEQRLRRDEQREIRRRISSMDPTKEKRVAQVP